MVKKTLLLAVIALMLIVSVSASILAAPAVDMNRRCSVTVRFQKDQEPVPGGSVICTRVGYIYADGMSVRYRRVLDHVDMINLQDPDTAQELERFVKQNNISGTVKTVGKDGKVTFDDLEPGVYLIRQKTAPEGYMDIKPFLVTLPYLKNGEYIYDLDASAKTELDKEPTEPTDPTEPTTEPTTGSTEPTEPSTGPTEPSTGSTEPSTGPTEPATGPTEPSTGSTEPSTGPTEPTEPTKPGGGEDSPQTGQLNWPVPVMAIGGVFCLCLGMYFSAKGKKEEE